MKFALFSDVHGNYYALKAVLEKISSWTHLNAIDSIYCLGDIITGHGGGEEVLDLMDQYHVKMIQGNHDQQEIPYESIDKKHWGMLKRTQVWEKANISEEKRNRIDQLPVSETIRLEDRREMMLFHSNPENMWDLTNSSFVSEELLKKNFASRSAEVLAYGHYHHTHVMHCLNKLLINVGSVSSSVNYHHDDFARFTLVDSQRDRLILHQEVVGYDLQSQILMDRDRNAPLFQEGILS